MQSKNGDQASLDVRHRTLLILWLAITMSVFLFLVLIFFTPAAPTENRNLSLLLSTVGIVPLGLSFLLKQRMLAKAVEIQQPALVHTAYVLAFSLCEVPALLSVLDHFATGSKYYYAGFIVAGLGLLLHFPQKKHLADASYRQL